MSSILSSARYSTRNSINVQTQFSVFEIIIFYPIFIYNVICYNPFRMSIKYVHVYISMHH